MIIVFINTHEHKVTIIDDDKQCVKSFDWNDLSYISQMISGRNVYYVTQAEIVQAEQIINLLSQISGNHIENSQVTKYTGKKYLRTTTVGALIIQGDGEPIIFDGPIDFKPLDNFTEEVKARYPDIDSCIEGGKLEIVYDYELDDIVENYKKKREKFQTRVAKSRDEALDNITVKGSVSDAVLDPSDVSDDPDAIEMDESDLQSSRADAQEFYSSMKKAGIDVSDYNLQE